MRASQGEASLSVNAPLDGLPDLAELLSDIVAFIQRYVVLSDLQAVALALWVLHTHALDAFDTTPYIAITSAVKRCGKTRLLEVLALLVARSWLTGRVSAAVLVRKIDKQQPTLLLDESDAAFSGPQEYSEALRGTLNSGYRRGMSASLCVRGKDWEPQEFGVFCPKAIAGIGHLPDTVADRSIAIVLRRRAPGEPVTRYRYRRVAEEATPVFDRTVTWADQCTSELEGVEPDVPDDLDDRAAEGWEPLLAIADLAGGEWPAKAREAAVALSVGEGREDDSLAIRLLVDIETVFANRRIDHIFSANLCLALNAIEDAPWADLRGKAIDPNKLSWRLKAFGIKPKQVRVGENTKKGYAKEDFEDTWSRYIPAEGETGETAETSESGEPNSRYPNVSPVSGVSANNGYKDSCLCGLEYTAFSPSMRPVCDQHTTPQKPCESCGGSSFWAGADAEWHCSGCQSAAGAGYIVEGLVLPDKVAT